MTEPRRTSSDGRLKTAPQKNAFPDLAVLWVPEAYSLGQAGIMGRQSAGAGFIRAVAAEKPRHLYCHAVSIAEAEDFKRTVQSISGENTAISWIPLLRPRGLHQA